MKKLHIISLAVLGFVSAMANAQNVSPVDFMDTNPYQLRSNASLVFPCDSYFSIGIGNICGDFRNLDFRLKNAFSYDVSGRPSAIDLNQLANSLNPENSMNSTFDMEVLGAGFKLRHGYLTYSHRIRFQSNCSYSDDLFQLAASGNAAFVGENNPADMKMDMNLLGFQEFALGYQVCPTEKLSVGGRVKLLFGAAEMQTEACNVKLYTDPDTYALRLCEDMAVRVASPMPFHADDGKLVFNNSRFDFTDLFCSPGFGVDLAATYRFGEKFSMTAAVNDLGFIRWNKTAVMLNGQIADNGEFYDDGNFLFQGIDVNDLQKLVSDEAYRKWFLENLGNYFDFTSDNLEPYTTMLHTNFLLRGTYYINEKHRLMGQMQGYCSGLGFHPALTVAYNANLNNYFDLCATYTMMKNSFDNLGFGVTCNLKFFHIYVATNNIIGCFNPLNTSGVNVQAGIFFTVQGN